MFEVLVLFLEDRREGVGVHPFGDLSTAPKFASDRDFRDGAFGPEVDDVEIDHVPPVVVIRVVSKQKLRFRSPR